MQNNFQLPPLITSETMVRVDDLDAAIEMTLYTDHSYSSPYQSAPSIELRSKVRQCLQPSQPNGNALILSNMTVKLGAGVCGGKGQGACRLLPATDQQMLGHADATT